MKVLQRARFSRFVPRGVSDLAKQGQAVSAFNFEKLLWLEVDSVDVGKKAKQWRPPQVGEADLAMLQYTSGSTNHPKGTYLVSACLHAVLASE